MAANCRRQRAISRQPAMARGVKGRGVHGRPWLAMTISEFSHDQPGPKRLDPHPKLSDPGPAKNYQKSMLVLGAKIQINETF